MRNCTLWPVCFCVEREWIWFIYRDAFLFKYSIKNKKVFFEIVIPINGIRKCNRFFSMEIVGKNIFLAPTNEQRIYIYNIVSKTIKTIELIESTEPLFITSYVLNNYIYYIPFTYRFMVRMDKEKQEIEYVLDIKNSMGEYPHFNDSCLIDDNVVICVDASSRVLYIIDVDKRELSLKEIGRENAIYDYITCVDNKIVVVDNKNERISIVALGTFEVVDEWWINGKNNITCNAIGNKYILFDCIFDGWMGVYDIDGKKYYEEVIQYPKSIWDNSNFRGVFKKSKNQNYYFNNNCNKLQIFDAFGMVKDEFDFNIDINTINEISQGIYMQDSWVIKEDAVCNINSYLNYVKGV